MIQQSTSIALINVFTVDPKDQQKLIDVLARATDEAVPVSSALWNGCWTA